MLLASLLSCAARSRRAAAEAADQWERLAAARDDGAAGISIRLLRTRSWDRHQRGGSLDVVAREKF